MSEQEKRSSQSGGNTPQRKTEKKPAAKKPGFFTRVTHAVSKWFRDFKSESKKIVWPTGKQVVNNTVIVCVFVYVLDVSFGFVRDTIVKLV